jgi:hypothetical protein
VTRDAVQARTDSGTRPRFTRAEASPWLAPPPWLRQLTGQIRQSSARRYFAAPQRTPRSTNRVSWMGLGHARRSVHLSINSQSATVSAIPRVRSGVVREPSCKFVVDRAQRLGQPDFGCRSRPTKTDLR